MITNKQSPLPTVENNTTYSELVEQRCKYVLKYLIPDYETQMTARQ